MILIIAEILIIAADLIVLILIWILRRKE